MTADEMFEEAGWERDLLGTESKNCIAREYGKLVGHFYDEIEFYDDNTIYFNTNTGEMPFDLIKAVAKAIEEMEEQK